MRRQSFPYAGRMNSAKSYSPYVIGHWRGDQAVGTGALVDSSGNGRNLALGSSLVDDGSGVYGANPGFVTVPGDTSGGGEGFTAHSFSDSVAYPTPADWTQLIVLAMFRMEQEAADHTSGNAGILGTGGGAIQDGWRIEINANGQLKTTMYYNGSSYGGGITNDATLDDGTEHHLAVAMNSNTDTYTTFINSAPDNTIANVDVSGLGADMNEGSNGLLALGTPFDNASVNVADMRIRDIVLMHLPYNVSNLQEIIRKHMNNPYGKISATDIVV